MTGRWIAKSTSKPPGDYRLKIQSCSNEGERGRSMNGRVRRMRNRGEEMSAYMEAKQAVSGQRKEGSSKP
ncbi:hypothetical protein AC579_6081 [Pseudocercospora musae]|uniref:Uncharacterized protein n=1 Tax=Pseudocercospora musae TaxID=113226 RepID=A0A139IAQ1_9PEZI|nr:hypothetical protein AC579_6081 [Pseudocercospora musae]